MRRIGNLKHTFVETIPEHLSEETVYVSVIYATMAHLCFCGCGKEVITPLSPTDWNFTYDGATVSIYPSIGNWSFPCRSHYWVINSTVKWADNWTQAEIDAGRTRDRIAKNRHFASVKKANDNNTVNNSENTRTDRKKSGLWFKFLEWFS